ncbi:MAG: DUF45 domain-containing protein [Verrucomicrobia bacterium]|nr:DUF45 domain-containing protein [Verrucomicrobiota bacterium]
MALLATQIDFLDEVPAIEPTALVAFLNDDALRVVDVTLTRNRVSMISVVFPPHRRDAVQLRLHEKFLDAPLDTLHALRTYLRTRRRSAWQTVADYARRIPTQGVQATRSPRLRTRGDVYDLGVIFAEVNATFFNGRVDCGIGWGRQRVTRRRRSRWRSIRYGSWDAATRRIRIHPLLDDTRVPAAFVRYIVFHEMLHTVVPSEHRNNRRYDHSPQFRKLERQFPEWSAMQDLSKQLLDILT